MAATAKDAAIAHWTAAKELARARKLRKRPYKEAWRVADSMAEIRKGAPASHFEPQLVGLFEEILPEILRLKQEWAERAAEFFT